MSTSHNGSKYALPDRIWGVTPSSANCCQLGQNSQISVFRGTKELLSPDRFINSIIIDAELSQVRNPFVQKISIKKIMDQDDNQLERFDNMYVLVGVNKISLMKYFTI